MAGKPLRISLTDFLCYIRVQTIASPTFVGFPHLVVQRPRYSGVRPCKPLQAVQVNQRKFSFLGYPKTRPVDRKSVLLIGVAITQLLLVKFLPTIPGLQQPCSGAG